MRLKSVLSLFALLGLLAVPAQAADPANYGTKDEAVALVNKAVELFKQDEAKAIAAINNKEPGLSLKDLYVTVTSDEGVTLAHGVKPVLVGKKVLEMKDPDGFEFIKAYLAVKDTGWIKYKWPDVADNSTVKEKTAYVVRVGKNLISVGYYEKP